MKRLLLLPLIVVLLLAAATPTASPEMVGVSTFTMPNIVVPAIDTGPAPDLAAAFAYLDAVTSAQIDAFLATLGIPVPDRALWDALHQCEQSDSWYATGYFGNGLHGGGGLGMSDDAWLMGVQAASARGVALPANVLAATIDQQMQGAQAFYDTYGWAWACGPYQ